MKKLFFFISALFISLNMMAANGSYSDMTVSGDTTTWNFGAATTGSSVKITSGTIDNGILFINASNSNQQLASSGGLSNKAESELYFPVSSATAEGTILMTTYSTSDGRWLQLFVGTENAGESKRLWSKLGDGTDGKKGPQSFEFTSEDLTEHDGTYYLKFASNNTEMKIATITIAESGPLTYHSVTYDLGAGTGTAPTQAAVAEGRKFDVASFEGCTAPEGMEFNGWNDGTNTYAPGDKYTMGTDDVTLTAQYKTYVPKYTISFYVADTLYETQIVNEGSYGNMPNEPTKELHNFAGWFNGEDQYYFHNPITADLTLTAHFTEMDDASDLDFEMFVGYNGKDDDLVKYYINDCNFSYNLSANDGLDSLDASKTKNNYQFLGLKLKNNGSYLIGKVAAGKRVDLVLGQLNNVKVLVNDVEAAAPNGGVEADSTAGHKTYDFRQAGTFKVLCTGTKTLVIKAIKFSDLPAVSDDATLSALTLDGVAIAGFAASKTSYKVTLAEGTTELPVVVATATDANATVSTVNYSTIEDYAATATFSVTAEDGTTVVNYTINFTIEKPVQYLQAPYESVMTADFELPEWLRGCEVVHGYAGSDAAVAGEDVIRFGATDTISMYIESCDSVIVDLSATGGRTVAIAVNGEEKANSGKFSKNTLKTLDAYIHSEEPVIVKIYGVDVTGGTTISRIKVTEYEIPTGINDVNVNDASANVNKVIENGQLVIIKDGVRYTVLGTAF